MKGASKTAKKPGAPANPLRKSKPAGGGGASKAESKTNSEAGSEHGHEHEAGPATSEQEVGRTSAAEAEAPAAPGSTAEIAAFRPGRAAISVVDEPPAASAEGEARKSSVGGGARKSSAGGGPRKSSEGGGPRKSSEGGRPRKSSEGGGPRKSSGVAAPAETEEGAPRPSATGLPGEEGAVPARAASEVKPGEDANANKEAEKKEKEEGPRRSTAAVVGGSTAELAAAVPAAGAEGGVEKVLESYFGKQAATVQKPQQKARRPRLIFENTYRLNPPKAFSVQPVERCIELTLTEMLGPFLYNTNEAGDLAGAIAEKIRARVMSCRFERFKIVVLVTIGQMKRQGMHIGFRNLWDPVNDSYAFGEFKNDRIYGSAQVFGIYYE